MSEQKNNNDDENVNRGMKPHSGSKQASILSPAAGTSYSHAVDSGYESSVRQPYPLLGNNSFPIPSTHQPHPLYRTLQTVPPGASRKSSRPYPLYNCPPAGSTPYPLSSAITSTHPLYTHPPTITQPPGGLPGYIPFKGFVGQPGVSFGLQNEKFDDPLEVAEGHWTSPTEFRNGQPTYHDEHERYYQERFGIVKSVEHGVGDGYKDDSQNEDEDGPTLGLRGGAPTVTSRKRAIKPPKKLGEEVEENARKEKKKSTKRVKGKRIERAFIIGSEAWPLDETNTRKSDTPAEHTKGWRVYVKVPEGQPSITTWLKKVQFKIYHTYNNPTRMVEEPPFSIEETGWGGFQVEVKLFFAPEVGSRAQDRTHFLQLEPYGGPEEEEKQKRDMMVRSEVLDIIEFNEPTEALFDLLTDDAQFVGAGASKAKGKGKKSASAVVKKEGEESVELPERSTEANPFSKETEASLLKLLDAAGGEIDLLIQREDEKLAEVRRKAKELRERDGVQA